MKKTILCNATVTFLFLSLFFVSYNVNAQAVSSTNSVEIILKNFIFESVKEVFNVIEQTKNKIELKFGIDIEKMATDQISSGVTAESSQEIKPDYTMSISEQISGLINSTSPADFLVRAIDMVRQFIKYIFEIMQKIIEMI